MKWQVLVVDKDNHATLIKDVDDLACVMMAGGFVATEGDAIIHWRDLKEVTITKTEN